MKNVMSRAWEIAKEGQKKFGGKVSEYFAESLKMAWNEWNKFMSNVEKLNEMNREAKRITNKFIVDVDFNEVVEQAKTETLDRYVRAVKNLYVMVNRMTIKLRTIKS